MVPSSFRSTSSFGAVVVLLLCCYCCVLVKCETKNGVSDEDISEGRTLVHHAMKRLSILLPVFMFKLGVMFTLVLMTMITSSSGLLVGTLLLALGVGHFIANRFASAPPASAHIALPHYAYHSSPHFLDRSDTVESSHTASSSSPSYMPYVAHAHTYGAWKTQ